MSHLLDELIRYEDLFKPKNHAGYWSTPIPSSLDQDMMQLVCLFLQSTNEDRQLIRSVFSDEHSFAFIRFSERMAMMAVRTGRKDYVFDGLIAHAIEGGKFDPRENMLVLSLLYHSAVKIGEDPAVLFRDAAAFAEEPMNSIIAEFPGRLPEARSIQSMGYEESSSAAGFCYKRNW